MPDIDVQEQPIKEKKPEKERITDAELIGNLSTEYIIFKAYNKDAENEFESAVSLIDAERTEKDYDWMSNIRIPEFVSHVLTQASIDVSQYFQTRDFVEVYIEDGSDKTSAAAKAAKKCINKTLNQRHIKHYQKFVRAKLINNLVGFVYFRCWWEKKTRRAIVDYQDKEIALDVDQFGNSIMGPEQIPATRIEKEAIEGDDIIYDRFNYDVLDPRNVVCSPEYTYSIQEKKTIFIRFEKTLEELKLERDLMGYINLDKLENIRPQKETETARETYNKDKGHAPEPQTKLGPFDVIERYGKYWCIVNNRNEKEEPTDISPGLDKKGDLLPGAESIECIISWIQSSNEKILIRMQPAPFYDANGENYKPLIRGMCYIHPVEDLGFGDGRHAHDLQIAIDDTFNMSNDRVRLATLPTLKVGRASAEDNSTLYIEPGHPIITDTPQDVEEMRISDNIGGAMQQLSMLFGKMSQADNIWPTTMGGTPEMASTTATAIAGAEGRTNQRTNYKSLTFENTALCELYWMILQMTFRFAAPETAMKMLGDLVFSFDPNLDYFYKPVSSSIETEYSKMTKIKYWQSILGYVIQIGHPDAVKAVNYILKKIYEYMGDEYEAFSNTLLNEKTPMAAKGADGQAQPGAGNQMPTSNQNNVPQSTMEQGMRGAMNE